MDVWSHDRAGHQERLKRLERAGRSSTKLPVAIREVMGNLRFPLDKTYHGCPCNFDRTNEHLSHLYEPLHPAVLRSLKMVVDAAHAAGIDACICGEMAGEPLYLPILLGLGFDELSMNAVSILRVKKILRRFSRKEAEKLVSLALSFSTAQEVESFLQGEIAARYSDSFD